MLVIETDGFFVLAGGFGGLSCVGFWGFFGIFLESDRDA